MRSPTPSGAVPPNLHLQLGDVYQGWTGAIWTGVLLDLPEPWQAIPSVCGMLSDLAGSCSPILRTSARCSASSEGLREVRGSGMLQVYELLQGVDRPR